MEQMWDKVQRELNGIRGEVINHSLYGRANELENLQIMMNYHVFAVWDFMSLLKALQRNLTCVDVPWFPPVNANTAFLINEIVVGEETDKDQYGQRMSHFELYLKAMQECGADDTLFIRFLSKLKETGDLERAFEEVTIPEAIRAFVRFTFAVINTEKPHIIAAVFTFGREDLIPDMFYSITKKLHNIFPKELETFMYYLERHIEVDGGHHGHLAREMMESLCGDDPQKWEDVSVYAKRALELRKLLWDAALLVLEQQLSTTFTKE